MLHIHHDDIILDKLPSLAEEFMLLLLLVFLGTAMLPFLVVLNLTYIGIFFSLHAKLEADMISYWRLLC
jgi:hypothetical protein